jgi:hypothetical protein
MMVLRRGGVRGTVTAGGVARADGVVSRLRGGRGVLGVAERPQGIEAGLTVVTDGWRFTTPTHAA